MQLAGRAEAVDFKPVQTKGRRTSDALSDLAQAVNATHTCIHTGQQEQAAWNKSADDKRDALDAKVDRIAGSVETLTSLFSKGPPAVKARVGWVEHLKLAGTIGACLGLAVFLYRMAVALAPAFHDFMLKVQT
jgi:hypothetical protein